MLLDTTIKRNLHLFTIMQKSHLEVVEKYARAPYGLISSYYHPILSDSQIFDALCADLVDATIKIFDCGEYRHPILRTYSHQLNIFIYQGQKSQQLQKYAEAKNHHLLTKRPPALVLSFDESKWQAQIEQWQETPAISLADYL